MPIDIQFVARCIDSLDHAQQKLHQIKVSDIEYDIYRAACVKEFEIILEQIGKLLRKAISPYLPSDKAAKQLIFKDLFRKAAEHQLISIEETQRWLEYRDNRNHTAHDYGEDFAEKTLSLLPQFILDATKITQIIAKCDYD